MNKRVVIQIKEWGSVSDKQREGRRKRPQAKQAPRLSLKEIKKMISREVGKELSQRIGKKSLSRCLRNVCFTDCEKNKYLNAYALSKEDSVELWITLDDKEDKITSLSVAQFKGEGWYLTHVYEEEWVQTYDGDPPDYYLNVKGYYQPSWTQPNTPL